jgi:hypothetical protein
MRVRVVIVTVVLAATVGACSKTTEPVPRPEGFVDVLDTISRVCADTSNTFECAKAVEQYRLGKGVSGVTRVGKRLSLAVKNGTVVDLTDMPDPSAEDYVGYTYSEHLACFGYHLVHRQLYDVDGYMLVNGETGARIDVPGVPVLAPDCERLAVVSGLPFAGSVLQIWRVNETGRAILEWGHQPDTDWTPGVVVWKSPVLLELPHTTENDPGTRRTLVVRLYTDGWRVEP